VRRNDEAVRRAETEMADVPNPIERAIRTLAAMSRQPAYLAELELWAASRTDPDLQQSIRDAERAALGERERVISSLFSSIRDNPNFEAVTSLSIEFLRGMALSSVLTQNPERYERLIGQWIAAVELLLRTPLETA